MSRPAPQTPQKQNFVQTALFMLVVYFGFMLYMNATKQNQQPNSTVKGPVLITTADYLRQLQEDDKNGLEVTAQQLLDPYNSHVDDDVKAKRITPAQAEAAKIQGATIVANAFYRGGLVSDDSNKLRAGYQIIEPFARRAQTNLAWTTKYDVYSRNPQSTGTKKNPSPEKPYIPAQVSPDDLHRELVDALSARNKTDLVWGVIPGGFQLIDFLVHLTGAQPNFSYAFAAFLLALAVRGAIFGLAQKQLMFGRQMSQLTPRINEIKKQFKDDQTEQSKRVMALYKEYGINPAAGCLPAVVQLPLFLTVYQCMLHYQFEFSKGYFLWINPNTSAATHGILAANLGQQDYILITIYGVTMLVSTLLTPVTDPTQYKQQRLMGIGVSLMVTIFMFMGRFPVVSGFVLYWTFLNLLATAQSFRAYRLPLPPLVKVNAPGGGVYPTKGIAGMWTKMMEDAQKIAEDKSQQIQEKDNKPSQQKPKTRPGSDSSNGGKPSKNGSPNPSSNSNGKEKGSNGKPSGSQKQDRPNPDSSAGSKHKPKKRDEIV